MGISTNKVLEEVKERLKKEKIILDYTNQKIFDNYPEIKNLQQQVRGTHADELETSMMLYIKPTVVNLDKAVRDDNDEIDPQQPGPLTRNQSAKIGVYSPTGAWGDPTLATVEKGKIIVKKYIELMEKQVSSLINDCLNQNSTNILISSSKMADMKKKNQVEVPDIQSKFSFS